MRIITPDSAAFDASGPALQVAKSIEEDVVITGDGTDNVVIVPSTSPDGLYLVCASFVVTASTAATGAVTGQFLWTDQVAARTLSFAGGTLALNGSDTIWDEATVSIGAAGAAISLNLVTAGFTVGSATVQVRAAVIRLR